MVWWVKDEVGSGLWKYEWDLVWSISVIERRVGSGFYMRWDLVGGRKSRNKYEIYVLDTEALKIYNHK